MLVFWWTGKGFWTILLVFLVGVVVAAIQGALGGIGSGGPWFAVAVLAIAAGANWIVGSRLNAASRARLRPSGVWKRLTYRPRNRFMSLPMESWSVAMVLVSAALALRGITG